MRLPQAPEPAFFDQAFRPDHAAWRPAILEVCAAHDVECEVVSVCADGSNLVAAVDDRGIVKVFPPFLRHQWESERQVLEHLRGATLPLRVPLLIAEGTRDDGWPYVIMEKLRGSALAMCWNGVSTPDRARLLEQIGSTMAAVHRLPLGELATLPPEWRSFLRDQKLECRNRHASLGVPQ